MYKPACIVAVAFNTPLHALQASIAKARKPAQAAAAQITDANSNNKKKNSSFHLVHMHDEYPVMIDNFRLLK